jgi:hypothetical protein
MSAAGSGRVKLVDAPAGPGRTTATLVASLAARLGTLHFVSGAAAVGSLVAGFAALGREMRGTVEGARLHAAIESARAGTNGEALWSALKVGDWASGLPPSPILDHLRNDLALLLADDLEDTLSLLPIPGEAAGPRAAADDDRPATFADCVVGLWVFAREIGRAVDALVGAPRPARDVVATAPDFERPGPLLR